MVTILEGESLLNDATALVALNASIAAIVSVVTPAEIAAGVRDRRRRRRSASGSRSAGRLVVRLALHSAVLDTSLSLVTPFVAFLLGETLHGSGVLAVVIAGLYLGYRAPAVPSAEARIAERLNWRTIQFLLENAVFLFIGLNLEGILEGAVATGPGLWPTVLISIGILARPRSSPASPGSWAHAALPAGPRRLRERGWTWGNGVAVASAGVRGVVTLAAVFLLPAETPSASTCSSSPSSSWSRPCSGASRCRRSSGG